MKLLATPATPGYPTEYLAARVQGRRALLIRDWQPFLAGSVPLPAGSDPAIRGEFTTELRWLHGQMNPELRRTFAPVFGFFALRTIFVCLRFIAAGQHQAALGLLAASLLHEDIKQILRQEQSTNELLPMLADRLTTGTGIETKQLIAEYAVNGIRGVERQLIDAYFETVTARRLHPRLAFFFQTLCDIRNSIALTKRQRWQIATAPHMLAGGLIPPRQLIRKLGRETITSGVDLSKIENRLLHSLSRQLRVHARQPDSVAILLDYLWRQYLQARNLGLLFHGRDIARPDLGEELVQ